MIKKVIINYPTFGTNGLKLEHKFKKGINIIEAENGYGKSTILNTIMSSYTFKYPGLKTLPEGTALIEMDENKLTLSKKNWIGTTHEKNDLYQYCMPGKFFDGLSTTIQRKILIDLLDLDYNKFMQDECDKYKNQFTMLNWSDDLEKNLKDKLKDSETRSNILIEDIMRLKSNLINFEEKEFTDVDKFYSDKKVIDEKVKEYNEGIIDRQTKYNSLLRERDNLYNKKNNDSMEINRLTRVNESLEEQLVSLRNEYINSNKSLTCDKCNSILTGDNKQKVLDGINSLGNKVKQTKENNELIINELIKSIELTETNLNTINSNIENFDSNFDSLSYDNIKENAEKFKIDFKGISESRLKEYEDYKSLLAGRIQIESELKFKEDQLKSINIIEIQSNLDKFNEIKSSFTKKLEEATKDLPLDIQLFETLKNGNIRETFTINYKGQDYYNLSNANKLLIQIKMSKMFIDKLGLDFILIDESSLISKSNLGLIKELSNDYQIIMCKATSWESTDL